MGLLFRRLGKYTCIAAIAGAVIVPMVLNQPVRAAKAVHQASVTLSLPSNDPTPSVYTLPASPAATEPPTPSPFVMPVGGGGPTLPPYVMPTLPPTPTPAPTPSPTPAPVLCPAGDPVCGAAYAWSPTFQYSPTLTTAVAPYCQTPPQTRIPNVAVIVVWNETPDEATAIPAMMASLKSAPSYVSLIKGAALLGDCGAFFPSLTWQGMAVQDAWVFVLQVS